MCVIFGANNPKTLKSLCHNIDSSALSHKLFHHIFTRFHHIVSVCYNCYINLAFNLIVMKIRWRQHEMIFVTMTAAITLAGYLWGIHNTTPEQYADPFINHHISFNLYRNVLLPDIGIGMLIYISYLVLNIFTIPRLLFPEKFEAGTSQISILPIKMKISLQGMARKNLKKFLWLLIQIALLTFLLGTALNFADYYKHEWMFHYPGFSIFFNKNDPRSQLGISGKYAGVLFLIVLYALYICLREVLINFIEGSGERKAFRILIFNQVTLFLVEYFLVPIFLVSFNFTSSHIFFVSYFSLVPSLLLVFMSNIYWLFPWKRENPFFSLQVVLRLLLSTFLFTFPFIFFLDDGSVPFVSALFILWAVQLFIITPVSWLVYQQKKDKILQLRGAEKALVKSTTDLQFLRSQINPHFLFNVLNTLYGTALQENAERTAGGIEKLGDMMRFMLHENNLDFIEMTREIEYLKNYISLQKLRTQSSPDISIADNISEQNCRHKIAPMLLIPLVENAFKHGISLKEKSWITIHLECNEREIIFEVRNSMHPRHHNDPEKERSGIGYKNVVKRLKLLYPGKHRITVNGDGKEFFVQLAVQP
jgi:two-component system LytT family sensor kinase